MVCFPPGSLGPGKVRISTYHTLTVRKEVSSAWRLGSQRGGKQNTCGGEEYRRSSFEGNAEEKSEWAYAGFVFSSIQFFSSQSGASDEDQARRLFPSDLHPTHRFPIYTILFSSPIFWSVALVLVSSRRIRYNWFIRYFFQQQPRLRVNP